MDVTQITTIIGASASLLCTLVVGALTFFIKKTLTTLEEADQEKRNTDREGGGEAQRPQSRPPPSLCHKGRLHPHHEPS